VLFDKGSYNEAIEKYREALKIDPKDLRADYEMAYTLQTINKGLEGIPYIEKILKSGASKYEAHELLGSIYDDNKQPEKAVDAYKAGIREKPDYSRLHLNLGITYMGLKKYPEAEECAINAIKIDPKHAGNHRLYALAAFRQNKRQISLLGWCNFLLLEPQSKRSPEAIAYAKSILNFGISKKGEKNININISSSELNSMNLGMQMAVVAATVDKKNLTSVDSLTLQLTSVFRIIGEQSDKSITPFFANYYAKYFQELSVSDNMPAFTRYISLCVYKDENTDWFNGHKEELMGLEKWISSTERNF
jgi:tetratricopeptide (TPR) repeat protein